MERFIRAMRDECTTKMLISLNLATMGHELGLYAAWYNEHRPSQSLGGQTPRESSCASPQTVIRRERGATVTVVISYVESRRHLPVAELREAA